MTVRNPILFTSPIVRNILLLAIVLSCATRAVAEPSGFRQSLFDGKSLEHWTITNCQAGAENGNLVVQKGNGLVRSNHLYRDFVLELEWKPRKADKWDSGIYFRATNPPKGRPWPRRYQINLLKGDEGNLVGNKKARSTGLIRSGDWNHFKLTVVGPNAKLEINGKHAWTTDTIAQREGYIGLQVEEPLGGQFEFRNIYVQELSHSSLFDGKTLAGWTGGGGADAKKCWNVEDGLLLCTGQKGPWLQSTKTYGDFNLRLEYRLKDAGNSGVYVRVPPNGNHHGKNAGTEVQILDDKAEKYKSLKPYQYCGSVYKIAAAEKHVGRPAGQWNSLEINCRGDHYQVTHNGVRIINANTKNFPALAERLKTGFIGLQNHSEQVWFKNIRIGPALESH